MKLISMIFIASALLMTGCSSKLKKSQEMGALNVNVTSDLKADVEVDMSKKISGTASFKRIFGMFDLAGSHNYATGVTYEGDSSGWFSGGVVSDTKAAAAYNAVTPSKADVIVAPQYIIKVKSYFLGIYKEVTAQVSGYAGKVKNIK